MAGNRTSGARCKKQGLNGNCTGNVRKPSVFLGFVFSILVVGECLPVIFGGVACSYCLKLHRKQY